MLHPCANERIDPVDATGFRKRMTSAYRETAWTAYGQGCRQISRDIYVLVPPTCSSKNIERCGTGGTLPALRPDRVSTPRFDYSHLVGDVDVGSKCRGSSSAVERPAEAS